MTVGVQLDPYSPTVAGRPTADVELLRVVADLGAALADEQTPPMLGRVLGWLLVNAPEPQTAEEMAEALQASRGAISMATQTLTTVGLISRRSLPGSRRAYYEARPETLGRALANRFSSITAVRKAVESALEVLGEAGPERRRALLYLKEMYEFFETELAAVGEAWQKRAEELGLNS
jgi:DNA-binding transcriptional regulator GbsR (MarR family)